MAAKPIGSVQVLNQLWFLPADGSYWINKGGIDGFELLYVASQVDEIAALKADKTYVDSQIEILGEDIDNETLRAVAKEDELDEKIDTEIASTIEYVNQGDQINANAIVAETNRATAAESSLQANIDAIAGGVLNIIPSSSPTANIFTYNASEAGTYTNFGGIVVSSDDLNGKVTQIKLINGVWTKFVTNIVDLSNYAADNDFNRNSQYSVNRWDGSVVTNRTISSAGNVATTASANDIITGFIPAIPGQAYTWSGYAGIATVTRIVVYYDINGVKVGQSASFGSGVANFTVTIPTGLGVAYQVGAIARNGTGSAINTLQVELGTTVTTPRTPFKQYIDKYRGIEILATATANGKSLTTPTEPDHLTTVGAAKTQTVNLIEQMIDRVDFLYDRNIFTAWVHSIWRKGAEYFTDFNWDELKNSISGQAYYFDPIDGNDSNDGLTEATPFKSLWKGATAVNIKEMIIKAAFYKQENSWQGWAPQNDLKVTIWGGVGSAEITTHTDLTFTADVNPNVYVASTALLIGTCADKSNLDAFGDYKALNKLTSVDGVAGQDNSFYYDAIANKLYVRLFNNRIPDSNLLTFINTNNVYINNNIYKFYAENIRCYGGNPFYIRNNSLTTKRKAVVKNCFFGYASVKDGALIFGSVEIALSNCRASHNIGDGFNYDDNSYGGAAFEYQCSGYYNGVDTTSTANNGSTAHSTCKMLRVDCNYQFSRGKVVQDIQDCYSYNVHVVAGNSLASGGNSSAFATNESPATLTTMWLLECFSVGGVVVKVKNFDRGVIYFKDGQVGNLTSGPNDFQTGSEEYYLNYKLSANI